MLVQCLPCVAVLCALWYRFIAVQVVYLHAGGFLYGSGLNPSTTPAPDVFVANAEVVFVSVNSRCAAHTTRCHARTLH
ncbi:hypothetical protein EON66_03100 [archaeon]|nr:MAG: hypothetical protein EON66_03100 [archaeon]